MKAFARGGEERSSQEEGKGREKEEHFDYSTDDYQGSSRRDVFGNFK